MPEGGTKHSVLYWGAPQRCAPKAVHRKLNISLPRCMDAFQHSASADIYALDNGGVVCGIAATWAPCLKYVARGARAHHMYVYGIRHFACAASCSARFEHS